jgi:hypothetical protein
MYAAADYRQTPIAAYALGGITDTARESDPAAMLACPDASRI